MSECRTKNKRVFVLGSAYSAVCFSEVVDKIIQHGKNRESGYMCVANVHTTMTGFFNPNYQTITNSSTYSVPDGQPIRWAMQLLSSRKQERVRGPSVMKEVCDRGRMVGLKHYLYGTSEKTLLRLRSELEKRYPGIAIVGYESPPYREPTSLEIQQSIKNIHNSGAEIVWVGLGAPKQEKWMWDQKDSVKVFMVGIGAAFDLLAGIVGEAPQWMQNLGLEWLYRIYKEPKRLWRRYIFNNPAFVLLFFFQLFVEKILNRPLWRANG